MLLGILSFPLWLLRIIVVPHPHHILVMPVFCFRNFIHSSESEFISHWDFNLLLYNNYCCWVFFHMLNAHYYVFFIDFCFMYLVPNFKNTFIIICDINCRFYQIPFSNWWTSFSLYIIFIITEIIFLLLKLFFMINVSGILLDFIWWYDHKYSPLFS